MPAESAFMARRILVVDDELYVTQLLAFILRRVGDEVTTADEGELACQQAAQLQPDLIIADFQMPLIDGMEMCRRLKANPATASIPVLMLTARGHRLSPGELQSTNVRCVLAKPFSPRELLAKVQDLIGVAHGGPLQANDGETKAAVA
jgi:CheY-like chemotaxis protein